jgi:hypothetical protein
LNQAASGQRPGKTGSKKDNDAKSHGQQTWPKLQEVACLQYPPTKASGG